MKEPKAFVFGSFCFELKIFYFYTVMEQLSEQGIKRAALSFFKTYYKFRPRISETEARLDVAATDGTIADGHLSFQTSEKEHFLATFEATSFATKHEVLYSVLVRKFIWDASAIAALCLLLVFAHVYIYQHIHISTVGFFAATAFLLVAYIFFISVFLLLFRKAARYRRIYAIEQFKLYDADEQWVVIGEDVFANPADPYFKELKKQCIQNGFGLLKIETDYDTHLIIRPAKEQVLKRRENLTFIDQAQIPLVSSGSKLREWLKKTNERIPWQYQNRFKNFYFKQIFVVGAVFTIISTVFYKEYRDNLDIVHLDKEEFIKEIQDLKTSGEPEDRKYMVDTAHIALQSEEAEARREYYRQKNKTIKARDLKDWKHNNTVDTLVKKENPLEEIPPLNPKKNSNEEPKEKKLTAIEIQKIDYDSLVKKTAPVIEPTISISPDCAYFKNIIGERFIVQDNAYSIKENAEKRQTELKKRGFEAYIIWLDCFEGLPPYYAVIFKRMFKSRKEAQQLANSYQRYLKNKRLETSKLLVRGIKLKQK